MPVQHPLCAITTRRSAIKRFPRYWMSMRTSVHKRSILAEFSRRLASIVRATGPARLSGSAMLARVVHIL